MYVSFLLNAGTNIELRRYNNALAYSALKKSIDTISILLDTVAIIESYQESLIYTAKKG